MTATEPTSPPPVMQRSHIALAGLLALIAGFVDAACFVGILQVFTAHVTGNIAALASAVVHDDGSSSLRITVLVAFGAGVASAWFARSATSLGEADTGWQRRVLQRLLGMEALWLVALVMVSTWLGPHVDTASPQARFVVALAGAAMGCQSAMNKLPTGLDHPSTVMTSNYTEWVLLALDTGFGLLRGHDREAVVDALGRFGRLTVPLMCFALGALAGAFGETRAGMDVMTLPLALLLFGLVWSVRGGRFPSRRQRSR